MTKRALIVVDLQNDYFPGGKWTLHEIEAAADNTAQLLAAARRQGELVVHIRHEFPTQDAPFFAPGSEGAKIHPKVLNQGDERVVVKNHINSFRETDLKAVLDSSGVTEVVICGAISHKCLDALKRAASEFRKKVSYDHDESASRDLEFEGVRVPAAQVHAAFMAALGFGYATTRSTREHLGAATTA